ncbi:MAG: HAD family hydrolase [Terriglobales bacterium]
MKVLRPIPDSVKLLIFDLDGTLIDSRTDLVNSVNGMLRHFARKELPAEVVATYIGDGAPMLVRRALGDPVDDHYLQDALMFFLDYYREHKLDHTIVYDGIFPALDALRDGRVMSVLTNKPVNPARAIVEALGLGKFFAQVYGGNSFPTKKPDPMGAVQLMREFGARPEETVMIGDSSNDVVTGRNTGMWTVGCTYGFSPHTLKQAPPDVLVDRPSELPQAVGSAAP